MISIVIQYSSRDIEFIIFPIHIVDHMIRSNDLNLMTTWVKLIFDYSECGSDFVIFVILISYFIVHLFLFPHIHCHTLICFLL